MTSVTPGEGMEDPTLRVGDRQAEWLFLQCPECNGMGEIYDGVPCAECDGTGKVETPVEPITLEDLDAPQ